MGTHRVIPPFAACLMTLAAFGLASAAVDARPPFLYQSAGATSRVPAEVLYSLAMQESQTRLKSGAKPWPWTLNVAGDAWRFQNRESACLALEIAVDSVGAKRVDAGLGQINVGWNGHRFDFLCDALDPYKNLTVSGQILREHFDATGDWVSAAGHYHRPAGGKPAERYRNGFIKHASHILGVPASEVRKTLGAL